MEKGMTVSLCMIAYNEESVLNGLFRDFMMQSYPHDRIEIVLVDAKSTDGTVKMMEEFKDCDYGFKDVQILTSEKRVQSACWNTALSAAKGDIIIRVDAHAHIPKHFVSRCVTHILEGEDIVGGGRPNITDHETPWRMTLLTAEESLFGSSIASYRHPPAKKEYHNSLFHAAYRREVFAKVGGFNEDLGRTEDNELHYRMRKAGYKLCSFPDIYSFQHTRNTLKGMIKQKYGNGYWIGLTTGVCFDCLSYYHFVPFIFMLAMIACIVLAFCGQSYPLITLLSLYFIFDMVNTVSCFLTKKFYPQFFLLPFIFPILHFSYGIGTIVGLIKMPFWKHKLNGEAQKHIENVKKDIIDNTEFM